MTCSIRSRIAALALAAACMPAFAQPVVETWINTQAERRPGAQYREDLDAIHASMANEDTDTSRARLEPIIAYCQAREHTNLRVVSVATTAEYEAFLAEHADGQPTEWIDMACPMAYHLAGYLYSGASQWSQALPWLDHAIRLAPYDSMPHVERAYVLAHSGHLAEGLAEYRAALALARAHPDGASSSPLALRGIGWVLSETGDLDGAQAAYEESLRIDPGNPTALNELEYIRTKRTQVAPAIPPVD